MGDCADERHDHSGEFALQHEITAREIDEQGWRGISQMPADDSQLAHANSSMTCYACHTSWTPTCFGLPPADDCQCATADAAQRRADDEELHQLQLQVLRDDAYFLGVDGTVTGHRVAPARSSCAVLVSSQNANREWLYYEQQTVSAEGFSGQAFSTFVPHTVRAKETNSAAIAMFLRRMTITRGWRRCCCRARIS